MLGSPGRTAIRRLGIPRFHLVPPGSNVIEVQMGIVVIQMPWWEAILFFAAVISAIWGSMSMVGFRTRYLTHRTDRTAEDMYRDYADSPRKQRSYARRHGGEWRNE